MPRTGVTRREAIIFGGFTIAVIAFLYFGLPRLAGFDDTWSRMREGDPLWLFACLLFELASFGGYVWLFRVVFLPRQPADRLARELPDHDGRAGRDAPLRGRGRRRRRADGVGAAAQRDARRARSPCGWSRSTCCSTASTWSRWCSSGVGLHEGLLERRRRLRDHDRPGDLRRGRDRRRRSRSRSCRRRSTARSSAGPATAPVAGRACSSASPRRRPPCPAACARRCASCAGATAAWSGAVLWWYLDIATLWAAFHAFGEAPPFFVIVMGYFVGMLANLLPLPGGIGGVDGGMIGAFVAFGVPFSLATVAVLTYRAFAFWLPTIPGAIAYLQLRGTVARWREEGADDASAAARVPAQSRFAARAVTLGPPHYTL